MAENIVTGRKYRILTDAAQQLWDRVSFWSKASDTEYNDGKNAETKNGAINGITSDVNGEANDVAASIKVVHDLNSSLGGLTFAQNDEGKWGYKPSGADAVIPFSNNDLSNMTIKESFIMYTKSGVINTRMCKHDGTNLNGDTGTTSITGEFAKMALNSGQNLVSYTCVQAGKYYVFDTEDGAMFKECQPNEVIYSFTRTTTRNTFVACVEFP